MFVVLTIVPASATGSKPFIIPDVLTWRSGSLTSAAKPLVEVLNTVGTTSDGAAVPFGSGTTGMFDINLPLLQVYLQKP